VIRPVSGSWPNTSAMVANADRLLGTLLGGLLLIIVPGWMLFGLDAVHFGPDVLLAYTVCAYSGIRLILLKREKLLCQTMFWLFVYVFLGAAPLAQTAAGVFPWRGSYTTFELVSAFGIVIVGLLAFDLGLRVRWRGRDMVSLAIGRFPEWRRRRLVIVCLLVSVTALVAIMQLGGPGVFLQTRVELGSTLSAMDSSESTFLRFIAITPIFAVFLVLFRVKLRAGFGRLPIVMLGCLIAAGGIMAFVNNPVSAPRFQVGAVVLGCFFCCRWGAVNQLLLRGGLVLGMLVLFPVADAFRVSRDVDFDALTRGMLTVSESVVSNPDFDAFQQVANSVRAIDASGHQYGGQLIGAALFWIPRRLWSDKPLHTGQWLAHEVGYTYDNLSAPLWAELFVDGSLFLVFIGFFVFGICAGRLDEALRAEESCSMGVTLSGMVCIVTAAYMFFLLRGALMPAVAYTLPAFLVVFTVFLPRFRLGPGTVGNGGGKA
jgi:hypothetical protein